jgi:hyaluronan synthase
MVIANILKSVKESNFLIHIQTFGLIIISFYVLYELQNEFEAIREWMLSTKYGAFLLICSIFLLAVKMPFFLFMLFNFIRYKPAPDSGDDNLPTCTIIVPAYNEGKFVFETIGSIHASDYPKHKIQLIAVDDGSKDDTWQWLLKAQEQFGEFVTVLQQPKNMGKRHALYRGIKMASGEIIVTIDSDSLIKQDTLRNLVAPFVADPKCGAVAGNVRIWNLKNAVIPKMLNVSFAFSFGFIRAAQSTLGSVLCTPGALSAYRKTAVLACLEEWINQKFFGVVADIGEDRAMTNMILKQGYFTRFQSNAIVYTNIPEAYTNLRRMFTRWERSNVRENIMMSMFAFTNFREGSKLPVRILLANQWLKIIGVFPSLAIMGIMLLNYPILFIFSVIASIFIFSLIPATYFAATSGGFRKSLWIFSYNIFYAFSLFWITPYAILTARRRGWLTRQVAVS